MSSARPLWQARPPKPHLVLSLSSALVRNANFRPSHEISHNQGYLQSSALTLKVARLTSSSTVVAADGLPKNGKSSLPDPFAVVTVDSQQARTTRVLKKTLNPFWNESFDV